MPGGGAMDNKYSKIVTPLYVFNMVWQALFSLAAPIGVSFFIAWLLDKYLNAGGWVYVVFITFGALSGLWSMISFIINISNTLDALEEQKKKQRAKKQNEGK